MKSISLQFLFAILILIIIQSCGSKKKGFVITDEVIDSVKLELKYLEDSTQFTWKTMLDEDDEKLLYLKRLIDEVSYTKIYDQPTYDSIDAAISALKSNRYDQSTMATSSLIDDYDRETGKVINAAISFARNHPNFQDYPIMDELISDIQEIDNQVIYRRVDYDNAAISFNNYVEKNQEIISKAGNVPSPKHLFQLSE